jgi:sn-glycerol 3-phosphate transport system permease protein
MRLDALYPASRLLRHGLAHLILGLFIVVLFLPLILAFVAASHDGTALMRSSIPVWPGGLFFQNVKSIFWGGLAANGGEPLIRLLFNSFVMAALIAFGKVSLAILSAFALVYFDFAFKKTAFALIFSTMMLPVEVRIVPTFQVIASFGWVNTFSGLTLPLMASATATFLFRQFFNTIPHEIADAAKLDGAGPFRFFFNILLPLSRPPIAAMFIIMFIYGWNQYLWPLVMTTESSMSTIVMGIRTLTSVADQVPQWHYIMTMALIALLPPCLLVLLCQQWFEKGIRE